jgi:hypothetical protein
VKEEEDAQAKEGGGDGGRGESLPVCGAHIVPCHRVDTARGFGRVGSERHDAWRATRALLLACDASTVARHLCTSCGGFNSVLGRRVALVLVSPES